MKLEFEQKIVSDDLIEELFYLRSAKMEPPGGIFAFFKGVQKWSRQAEFLHFSKECKNGAARRNFCIFQTIYDLQKTDIKKGASSMNIL